MKTPLISICIATYNRAEYIGETLESIIPQVTDEVEIVIVDGASTDGTCDVVKSYIEACKQINYVQLPFKGGVDQDFCKAVEFAKGEYCWLFTDDDLLKPNAISTVLNEITKGYSLIIVNAQVMNKDFSKILENKRLRIDTNEIYDESMLEQLFSLRYSIHIFHRMCRYQSRFMDAAGKGALFRYGVYTCRSDFSGSFACSGIGACPTVYHYQTR